MKNFLPVTLIISTFLTLLASCGEIETKINVTDEEGKAVEGAEVKIFFQDYQSRNDVIVTKSTNEDGLALALGKANASIKIIISRSGFYTSEIKELDHSKNVDLSVKLRPIGESIPLYAKKIVAVIPRLDEQVGFDLEKADWIQPYGVGISNDLFVLAKKTYQDVQNYHTEVDIIFVNELEGLLEDENISFHSEFKSTRLAPLKGYEKSWKFVATKKSKTGYQGSTSKRNFIFRTRIQLDQNNEIERCNYGKIIDGFGVSRGAAKIDMAPIITFTYYFNPQINDRNLEFDPSHNLFENLPRDEQVLAP